MSGGATCQIADFIILCYYDDSKVLFHTYPVFFLKRGLVFQFLWSMVLSDWAESGRGGRRPYAGFPISLHKALFRTQTNLLSIDLISSANWCSWCGVPQATL